MQNIDAAHFAELKRAFDPVRGTFVIEPGMTDEGEQFVSLSTRWEEDAIGIIERVVDGWRLVIWFSEAVTFRTAAEIVEHLLHGPDAALAAGYRPELTRGLPDVSNTLAGP
jgi:hypothetical protein